MVKESGQGSRRTSRRRIITGGLAATGALVALESTTSSRGPRGVRRAEAQNPSHAVLRVIEIGRAINQGLIAVEFLIVATPSGVAEGVAILDPTLAPVEFNRQLALAGVRHLETFGTVVPVERVLVLGGATS